MVAFSDRLSSNIGDLDTKEYFLETYGRYGMTGGIMMGNGEIEKQGDSLPDASIIVLVWIRLHAPMI